MYDNQIVTLDESLLNELNSLELLRLAYNHLVILNRNLFKGLLNIIFISLHNNLLDSLPTGIFHGFTNLEELYLSFNLFNSLKADVFHDLVNLHTLTLRGNNLKHMDPSLLQSMTKLNFLSLQYNRLQNVPIINHLTELELISLDGNDLLEINSGTFSNLQSGATLLVSQHEICECYVTENITCSASLNRSPYLTCERLLSDRVLVIMIWAIGINALCGNAFVLCWRNKNKEKNKMQSLLLSNLAMSDLLMGVYMIIVAIADIKFGKEFPMRAEMWRTSITCKISGALSILSSEASVFFVTIISIDRLICIKCPYSAFKFGTKSIKV